MASGEKNQGSSKPQTKQRGTKGKNAQPRLKSNQLKRLKINEELKDLQNRVDNFVPPSEITLFSELPMSSKTQKGLKSSHFLNPTPIQSLAIPPALQARDILGSAKTGSGKTLAFLIPLLERLYLEKWGPMDGLGAVVISPTRELAVQTFMQLRDIGKYHNFSAGLVIGGKPLKEEQERLGRMNILIATPGRLLQHLDSTVGFDSSAVKVLVLDEADRLLDLGFLPALKAIVSHFSPVQTAPGSRPSRQTLLFSATQSKDLAALAKLSLHEPLYISCNKPGEEGVMPANLEQYYAVVPLERKLDALWGFVKSHLKMKGIVFVTSGKQVRQVRFIFETFRRLHPGLPLMHLHGKQKQPTRLDIFQRFSSSKSALLICTDVAARGLDFPAVDWVIQLDCPDDVDTYIHRVGRTARYQSAGTALTILCPSEEEGMKARWGEKAIEVKRIKIKESKMGNLKQSLQNFAFKEPEIKYLGQRAFISYMKSIHIQKDKSIFKIDELPAEAFAESMGLLGAPQIKLGNQKATKVRGPSKEELAREAEKEEEDDEEDDEEEEEERVVVGSDEESGEDESEDKGSENEEEEVDDEEESGEGSGSNEGSEGEEGISKPKAPAVRTKFDRMFERKNQSILTPHYTALITHDADNAAGAGEADDDDDVFTLARRDHNLSDDEEADIDAIIGAEALAAELKKPLITSEDLSKRKLKAAASKRGLLKSRPGPEKVLFDEETGEAREFYKSGVDVEKEMSAADKRREYLEKEREIMKIQDKIDKEVAREKKKELKRKRKERERELRQMEMGDEPVAYLGGDDGYDSADEGRSLSPSPAPSSEPERHAKKQRRGKVQKSEDGDLEDEEALALRLLQGS
ncbi:ATP-dependent RNA helicase DBP4 [Cryptococcus gattii Ru294]|nr:ATP-dependent RNA helicase DBP4 [Cryptococcus gattii Ru294]